MPVLAIPFPQIDPVLIDIGPLVIRWYALSYVAGLLFAWLYVKRLMTRQTLWGGSAPATELQIDDLLFWASLGVILGGRLGYVLFYNAAYYASRPLEIFVVWQGGMSFHGGFLGVILAVLVFSWRKKLRFWSMIDAAATATPIGLLFGRIANFINAELYGRVSDVPWAMVFPTGGPHPRHPSQLYEAFLEGLVLFIVIRIFTHKFGALQKPGFVSGIFAAGYGASRLFVEFFRQPDGHIGFLAGGLTMGMVLSVPMIALGMWLMMRARVPAPELQDP